MSSSKFNSEGYYDPVVYEALTKVEAEERAARAAAAYRPLVYICSPYVGDIEKNTYRARAFSRFAVEKNCIPMAPHAVAIWTVVTVDVQGIPSDIRLWQMQYLLQLMCSWSLV